MLYLYRRRSLSLGKSLKQVDHSSSKTVNCRHSANQYQRIVRSQVSATSIGVPAFHCAQRVTFIGGSGIVRDYKPELKTWSYLVEMALGAEPTFGRVGAETMVFLSEEDLAAE